MNDMIKAERGKIISKKPTKILFVMGIILIVAYFFLFQFGYTSVFYNYDTGKMDTVSGFAAIEQRKETANMFAGKLTPDLLTLMEQRITEAQTATATKDENSAFSALHVYRDQAAILEYMTEPDGEMKSIEEAYPNHESIILRRLSLNCAAAWSTTSAPRWASSYRWSAIIRIWWNTGKSCGFRPPATALTPSARNFPICCSPKPACARRNAAFV